MQSKRKNEASKARAAETRKKIQLGGLLVKHGLSSMPFPMLNGLLIEARERAKNENNRRIWLANAAEADDR